MREMPIFAPDISSKATRMEEIIRTAGIAVTSALGVVILIVIIRSQWNIWRREWRQEKQHSNNK